MNIPMKAPMKAIAGGVLLAASVIGSAVAADTPAAPSGTVCLYPRDIESSKPISDREIVFKMRNGKMWLNTLKTNCPGLKFEAGFSWTVRGDSVCSNLQMITVLRRGNACLLGEFTPYTPPPAPAQN